MPGEIPIRCKGNRTLPYLDFKAFQGNLKTMSRVDFVTEGHLIARSRHEPR